MSIFYNKNPKNPKKSFDSIDFFIVAKRGTFNTSIPKTNHSYLAYNETYKYTILYIPYDIHTKIISGQWIRINKCKLNYYLLTYYGLQIKSKIILQEGEITTIDNDEGRKNIVQQLLPLYQRSIDNITDYITKTTEDYQDYTFKKILFNSCLDIFDHSSPKHKCIIMTSVVESANWKSAASGTKCYVFNCACEGKKFSIIHWNDVKGNSSYPGKFVKRGEPVIFGHLKLMNYSSKKYFNINDDSFVLYDLFDELKSFLSNGKYKEFQSNNIQYIWTSNNNVDDICFYKQIALQRYTNLDKARQYVQDNMKDEKQVYFILNSRQITECYDFSSMFKFYCSSCGGRTTIGLINNCCIQPKNPWLELNVNIKWLNNDIGDNNYPYKNTNDALIIITKHNLKQMLEFLENKDFNIEGGELLSEFYNQAFFNKHKHTDDAEANYFIPIVKTFFNEISKLNIEIQFTVKIKSGRRDNYEYINFHDFTENISNEQNTKQQKDNINNQSKSLNDTSALIIDKSSPINEFNKNVNNQTLNNNLLSEKRNNSNNKDEKQTIINEPINVNNSNKRKLDNSDSMKENKRQKI